MHRTSHLEEVEEQCRYHTRAHKKNIRKRRKQVYTYSNRHTYTQPRKYLLHTTMASLPEMTLPFSPNGVPSPAMLSALQAGGGRPPHLPPPPTSVAGLAAGINPSLMSHYYSLMADKLWGAGVGGGEAGKAPAHSPGSSSANRSPPPDVRTTISEGKDILSFISHNHFENWIDKAFVVCLISKDLETFS